VTKSLSTPDRYERAVAQYLSTFCNVKAERPVVGTKYPDVLAEFQGVEAWIEVKMNETDRLGNPRVEYNGEEWWSRNEGPTQTFTAEILNQSSQAEQFIDDLKDHMSWDKVILTATKEGLKDPAAVPLEAMKEFLEQRDDKYVHKEKDVDVSGVTVKHYNEGKSVPAHYLQMGDQFFRMGDENPWNLDIPHFEGTGLFNVRIGDRSEKYEVQPDIKIVGDLYSPVSIAPGTMKPHPF